MGPRAIITIAAKDVRAGDALYNRHAYHPSAAWVRVTAVRRTLHNYVILTTPGWETWKHPEEGIAVLRGEIENNAKGGIMPAGEGAN